MAGGFPCPKVVGSRGVGYGEDHLPEDSFPAGGGLLGRLLEVSGIPGCSHRGLPSGQSALADFPHASRGSLTPSYVAMAFSLGAHPCVWIPRRCCPGDEQRHCGPDTAGRKGMLDGKVCRLRPDDHGNGSVANREISNEGDSIMCFENGCGIIGCRCIGRQVSGLARG